jgi:hypothetical protein
MPRVLDPTCQLAAAAANLHSGNPAAAALNQEYQADDEQDTRDNPHYGCVIHF